METKIPKTKNEAFAQLDAILSRIMGTILLIHFYQRYSEV